MRVYLDHAASSPLRPEARAAMIAAFDSVGNPSSVHGHGQAAKRSVESARETIAEHLGAEPIEVVLTSGGTEGDNLAVTGIFAARNRSARRPRILIPALEHHAHLDVAVHLERSAGAKIEVLPVDARGVIDRDVLAAALKGADDVALVACALANNEVGTVQPVRDIARIAHEHGVPVHVDAVAALGHLPVSVRELNVDALTVSAHKIGGPTGVGALVVRRDAEVAPLFHGGGHQRGIRSGTLDLVGAAGFAAAIAAACEPAALASEVRRLDELAAPLVAAITEIEGAELRGPAPGERLWDGGVEVRARAAGNVHATFAECQGDSLLFLLDMAGISVSTGSACQAGVVSASHVLRAMGLEEREALGALRMTLGWSSTEDDVAALIAALPDAVATARRAGITA